MRKPRVLPLLLAVWMLCLTVFPAAAAGPSQSTKATTMQLMKTEGTVNVTNASGRSLTKRNNMLLYNGYHVETKAKSYAWINLDSSKLVKLDAVSEAEVRKSGKSLELLLSSGSFFFNVTSPLKEGETLNIRTATMVVGIRGTSGWFKAVDQWSTEIYVLEGTVQCSVSDPVTGQAKEATIQSGEMAVATAYPQDYEGDKCDIVQEQFEPGDIDGFVLEELAQNPELCANIYEKSGLDVLGTVEATQERREQDEQKMQETLDRIEDQLAEQDSNTSTGPVWGQEDPVPSKPDNSTDIDSGSGGSSDNSGGSRPNTPTPPPQRTEPLTGAVSAEQVQTYFDSGVREVVLAGAVTIDGSATIDDGGLRVPPGKILTISQGAEVQFSGDCPLTIESNPASVGMVNNYGTLNVSKIENNGTLANGINDTKGTITGNLETTGYFSNVGKIEGNVTQTGGTTDMVDGTITGSVEVTGGTFTLSDGTIEGGVQLSDKGTFTMKGGKITGEISGSDSENFHWMGGTINGKSPPDDNPNPDEEDETIGGDGPQNTGTPGNIENPGNTENPENTNPDPTESDEIVRDEESSFNVE